ncbi:MAG: argininosuccinate lyase [Gammaproteobacteria bacterium]|jgi:argininosuccinate lyase|nr:argininosuccinate lyase [Gammaproteobacteria bacterium]MBT5202781.1 argininosuccinate lyase [Gammaproteobacteria bacterium]MBT5603077.1 argininosuccinate lyase [Gammaproteobacteria bacterium]MBT6246887.1 argininosuccinate lyase [Gammaproteobacteria bacterium]
MTLADQKQKLWDGRFTEATDAFVESFTASINFDQILADYDIEGSIAHARMLEKAGIIGKADLDNMLAGLGEIRQEIALNQFEWSVQLEDVHMNIESALTARIGELGKVLHTARSRNDQIATDLRLYLRDQIDLILQKVKQLLSGILDLAETHTQTIMPGFTHLQIAQPVVFGHHLMAWYAMLLRDAERLTECRKRVNCMPLGSAALAGTSFPIDRAYTAELLGFESIADNSLDAVSDRDFVIEFSACASLLMMHLSRWSEEMILWTSTQFDFIELPDRFCTGSSIMPQKKNPDVPELVRGKSGRVFGSLMALLTLMKGQPLAYNKDNQEDKEPLFDTVQTVLSCLTAFADMVPNIKAKKENMARAALTGYATATDLADYLVRQGLAFRDAHAVVGRLVALGIDQQKDLAELSLEQLKAECDLITEDVYQFLDIHGSVASRNHLGGTAPETVRNAITLARQSLNQNW